MALLVANNLRPLKLSGGNRAEPQTSTPGTCLGFDHEKERQDVFSLLLERSKLGQS